MVDIHVEADWFNGTPPLTESVCWLAREVLGGYMDNGCELDTSPPGEEMAGLEDDEPDDETASELWVHETPVIAINKTERASLSNLPYILDENDMLVPVTDPGFIALRIEPTDIETIIAPGHRDERSKQVVFRPPNPVLDERAAIYVGYSLDETARLDEKDKKSLGQLAFLLEWMRGAYRELLSSDSFIFSDTYLSIVPRRPISDDAIMHELFDSGET